MLVTYFFRSVSDKVTSSCLHPTEVNSRETYCADYSTNTEDQNNYLNKKYENYREEIQNYLCGKDSNFFYGSNEDLNMPGFVNVHKTESVVTYTTNYCPNKLPKDHILNFLPDADNSSLQRKRNNISDMSTCNSKINVYIKDNSVSTFKIFLRILFPEFLTRWLL